MGNDSDVTDTADTRDKLSTLLIFQDTKHRGDTADTSYIYRDKRLLELLSLPTTVTQYHVGASSP